MVELLPQVYHRAVKSAGGKAVRHVPAATPRHSSPTLSTAHAPVTHVKASQTVFPVKPDNSSGPTHGSPSERPLRTKATFRHGKLRKKHRGKAWERQRREDHPSRAKPNHPPCPFRHEVEAKARRAASKPRRHPSPCSKPWAKASKDQVSPHGFYRSGHLSHRSQASTGPGSHSLRLGLTPLGHVMRLPCGSRLT